MNDWSESVDELTEEERKWWEETLTEREQTLLREIDEEGEDEESFVEYEEGFAYSWEGDRLVFRACPDEGTNLSAVVDLVCKFLEAFRPDECWVAESSEFSDGAVGDRGGVAYFVTAKQVKSVSTWEWIERKLKSTGMRSSQRRMWS